MNLVPDGDIPTTDIIEGVLRAVIAPDSVYRRPIDALRWKDICLEPTIFSRVCIPVLKWLPSWMATSGGRYGYFLDDNFWEYRVDNDLARHYSGAEVRQSLDEFVARAAAVFVNSSFLADELRRRFGNIRIFLLPAPFDFSNIAMPGVRPPPTSGPLRVGYAGSERGEAFGPVVHAIHRILEERPGEIEIEFIGHMPESLRNRAGVSYFPALSDYREFLEFKQSRQWDVGLAPLSDDAFSQAKTNNKFREYGALSIAGIYSAVAPYRSSVMDGVNGLLVEPTENAWSTALLRLLDDREATRRMGANAFQHVWENHRIAKVVDAWKQALAASDLRPARHGIISRIRWIVLSNNGKFRTRIAVYDELRRAHGIRTLFRHIVNRMRQMPF